MPTPNIRSAETYEAQRPGSDTHRRRGDKDHGAQGRAFVQENEGVRGDPERCPSDATPINKRPQTGAREEPETWADGGLGPLF